MTPEPELYNLAAFLGLALIALAVASSFGGRRQSSWPQRLLVAGVAFRVLGALARYEIAVRFYNGSGDAFEYYRNSLPMAEALRRFEISPFSPSFWAGGEWRWGTGFIMRLSALILSVLGPSLRCDFLVFSLIAFAGIMMIATALGRMQPERKVEYASYLFLWPSLWFWPSSVGKESLTLLAVGLATLGYVGSGTRIRWLPLLAGIGVGFLVRPHVAAVIAIALVVAEWFGSWGKATPRRVIEGLVLAALSIVLLFGTIRQFGKFRPELDGIVDFVEWERGQTLQGGSNVGNVSMSIAGALGALVNIWMRPFPWEAHNPMALVAAIEIGGFWLLAFGRLKLFLLALRHWRAHRMLRFGLPFLIAYTLMIGMTFGNLGLIARQRTPIFPFMLVFVLAVPRLVAPVRNRALRTPEPSPVGITMERSP